MAWQNDKNWNGLMSGLVEISSKLSAGGGGGSGTPDQTETNIRLGATDEAAPATDTDTSALNGRLQRIAQRLSGLLNIVATDTVLQAVRDRLPSALVGDRLKVDGSGVTQPVSAQALPLPDGAATETTLSSLNGKLPSILVADRLKVDGSGVSQPVYFSATQPVAVANFPATQPVSGTVAVSNFPATQPVSGGVNVNNFPATQPISGTVSVGNFPATQPISATSLPLPAGAATNAMVQAVRDRLPSALNNDRLKVEVPTTSGTLTNRSGTLTTANTAQQVMAANASRRYLLVQNVSGSDLWIDFGTTAVANQPSVKLLPNGSLELGSGFVSTESVSIIGAAAGAAYTAKEG